MGEYTGNTEADIKKVDSFNDFMVEKKLLIIENGLIYINPEKVMIKGYEYTWTEAKKDYNALYPKKR